MNRARRRYLRTTLLGVAAMAALIWSAVDQFGISWEEVWRLFLGTLVGLLLVIAAAALVALCWVGIRQLLRRGD